MYILNGILNINKPKGISSTDVVKFFQRVLSERLSGKSNIISTEPPTSICQLEFKKVDKQIKVGHAGTLDPLATGCLLIGFGTYTKELSKLQSLSKTYRAIGALGIETDTLDITGKVIKTTNSFLASNEEVKNVCKSFLGEQLQKPPLYSALKYNGKPMYKYARSGSKIDFIIKERLVTVYKIELLRIFKTLENNTTCFEIQVECSKGTYIRSLVRDIGVKLNSCSTVIELERTKNQYFNIENSIGLHDIKSWNDMTKTCSLHTSIFESNNPS